MAVCLLLRLSALNWRFHSRHVPPFLQQPLHSAASSFYVCFLFLQRRQSLHTSLFPFLLCKLPASPRLLLFLPGSNMPSARPPSGLAAAPAGAPSPARQALRGGPAGTRSPIPYMDKCVQAKSGIQAPDVSLQLSGHRTGARGEGVGTVGRKEGERHQPAAAPALPKFHFLSVGPLPGPARAFPG